MLRIGIVVIVFLGIFFNLCPVNAQQSGRVPPEACRLFNCEMKVVWDSIKTKGEVDEDYVASGFLFNCIPAIKEFGKIGDNNFLAFTVIKNLAFANKKYATEGAGPFKMYEGFDYSGVVREK